MKTLSHKIVTIIIILMVFININLTGQIITNQKTIQTIGYDLPFMEDWSLGSFVPNQWETEGDNWQIVNYNGNIAPCARFSTFWPYPYSGKLTSYWFNGNLISVGKVYLDFDLKLEDVGSQGTEWIIAHVYDGINWHAIDSISNQGSFEWSKFSFEITEWTIENDFKVCFEAKGIHGPDQIAGWNIDNIEVYRECDKPYDLTGYPIWNGNDEFGAEIAWSAPESVFPVSLWKHWDSGQNFSGVGLNSGGNFFAAIRWNTGSLSDIDGDTIRSIRFFPNDDGFEYFIIKIWTGENAADLIYSDTAQDVVSGIWHEHQLNETIIIDQSLEYWVGYELVGQTIGSHPAGYDSGPANAGYGDLIMMDDIWDHLSDFGLNYNWNIQMFIESEADQNPENLIGFNILKKTESETDYLQIGLVDFVNGYEWFSFFDPCNNYPMCDAFYKVNALWGHEGDTCISNFAMAREFPMDDFVYVMYAEGTEDIPDGSKLKIYPNPTTTMLNLKSENKLKTASIFNLLGQMIREVSVNNEYQTRIDVSDLKNGVYLIKIETAVGVFTKKIVIE